MQTYNKSTTMISTEKHNLHVHLAIDTFKFLKLLAKEKRRTIKGQLTHLIENERDRRDIWV